MGIQQRLLEYFKQEGLEEGKEEGMDITLEIIDLLKAGQSIEFISKKYGIDEAKILKIKDHLDL